MCNSLTIRLVALADGWIFQDSVYFRVNYDKFNVHIRNTVRRASVLVQFGDGRAPQLIETAARERFNDGAALVMRAVLKVTESKQLHVGENGSGIKSFDVLDVLDLTED
jgi:DNA-directed RNA polymerase III subunit RPC3